MSFYPKLVNEINSLRRNPPAYGDKLLSFKSCFKGLVVKFPGQKVGMQTNEGFAAFEESAKYLKTMSPICDMVASKGLTNIAKEYLAKMSECSPDDVGNIEIDSIIKKYGSFTGTFNNAMDFGSDTPELVVVNLIVSDGDPQRSNRDLLLNPELKRIGIASGTHNEYGNLTILLACTTFKNIIDKDDAEDFGGMIDPPIAETERTPEVTTTTNQKDENANKEPDLISCVVRERLVKERGNRKKKIITIKQYKTGKIKREVKYVPL